MQMIGLTGGIATGKTTVSKMLTEFGVPVIDADVIYRTLSEKGNRVWKAVYEAFGEDYFLANGDMDRKTLGDLIFSDSLAREKLNQLTHPIVKEEMQRILAQIEEEQDPPLVVLDVPLLFESGWDHWLDEVWVVVIPEEMQLERLIKRDKFSREQAINRIKSQMRIDEKQRLADRVIDNSGSLMETRSQVQKLLDDILFRGKTNG